MMTRRHSGSAATKRSQGSNETVAAPHPNNRKTKCTKIGLQIMGGFGSGRGGGGPMVESALRLDIDDMMQWGGIRAFARLAGEMRFNFYGDDIDVKFESHAG